MPNLVTHGNLNKVQWAEVDRGESKITLLGVEELLKYVETLFYYAIHMCSNA